MANKCNSVFRFQADYLQSIWLGCSDHDDIPYFSDWQIQTWVNSAKRWNLSLFSFLSGSKNMTHNSKKIDHFIVLIKVNGYVKRSSFNELRPKWINLKGSKLFLQSSHPRTSDNQFNRFYHHNLCSAEKIQRHQICQNVEFLSKKTKGDPISISSLFHCHS